MLNFLFRFVQMENFISIAIFRKTNQMNQSNIIYLLCSKKRRANNCVFFYCHENPVIKCVIVISCILKVLNVFL